MLAHALDPATAAFAAVAQRIRSPREQSLEEQAVHVTTSMLFFNDVQGLLNRDLVRLRVVRQQKVHMRLVAAAPNGKANTARVASTTPPSTAAYARHDGNLQWALEKEVPSGLKRYDFFTKILQGKIRIAQKLSHSLKAHDLGVITVGAVASVGQEFEQAERNMTRHEHHKCKVIRKPAKINVALDEVRSTR